MELNIKDIVCRLVSGHPMERRPVTDKNDQPMIDLDGKPKTSAYIGLAIQKKGEKHWSQTPWGQQIYALAKEAFPKGEYNHPSFSWKVVDGDSTEVNKKGNKNCDREGYPGHWIIHGTTQLQIRCYHRGKYDAIDQIQNKEEIKRGDYVRAIIIMNDNKPSETPGIYMNPSLIELHSKGVEIEGQQMSAAAAFGDNQGEMPSNAQLDEHSNGPNYNEPMYSINGQTLTLSEWMATGYTQVECERVGIRTN